MSMVETNIITTAIEGLGGGINEINANMNAATVDSLPGQVVYIRNQTSNAVLVNVSGKGELHYVLGESMNSGSCYKIEIDGETFYARNPVNSNLTVGYFSKEGLLSFPGGISTSSTNVYLSFEDQVKMFYKNTYAANAYAGVRPFAELTRQAFEAEKEAENTNLYYTQKPLRFEQSLKITIDGTASEGSYNYIKYTLDD